MTLKGLHEISLKVNIKVGGDVCEPQCIWCATVSWSRSSTRVTPLPINRDELFLELDTHIDSAQDCRVTVTLKIVRQSNEQQRSKLVW